jgi:SAM-dependent methyltransferase
MGTQIRPFRGAYDPLYSKAKNNILWGDSPGRLILNIDNFIEGTKVLDAGCGDGKNSVFLEERGFKVSGFDISGLALRGLRNRFKRSFLSPRGLFATSDLYDRDFTKENYDAIISYGLYHCLKPNIRIQIKQDLFRSVKLGGIVCFTCFTPKISIPKNHGTFALIPASINEVMSLFLGWRIEYFEDGVIQEKHKPGEDIHHHSAVWIVARKINI